MGLQESVVLGMADGFAQGTRRAALVNLHSSAGVGHALGNLFTAYKKQTAQVVTAGQQARSILPYEPFLFAERAAEFPRPFVKWSCEPARAALPRLDGTAMTDAYVLQQIAALRAAESVIVEEALSSRGLMHDRLPIVRQDTFYTTASGGLGHGLPAAVGLALARPADKVIAVLDDGSTMYAIQGCTRQCSTAAR